MTTSAQMRRLAELEAAADAARTRTTMAELEAACAFYAKRDGLPFDELLAESTALAPQMEGMTSDEMVRWYADDARLPLADVEAVLETAVAEWATWEQSTS